jgi:hypothetical protein
MTPASDRITHALLAVIALALVWQTIGQHAFPRAAEAARDTVAVNIERIAGQYLTGGAIPIRCADLPLGHSR